MKCNNLNSTKIFLLFSVVIAIDVISCDVFKLGYLTGSTRRSGDMEYQRPGLTISGAVTIAVNEVNEKKLKKLGHSIEFVVAETYGEEISSIRQTASLWKDNVHGYIGPQETCLHEGRMAAAFNLPMISYFCTNYETSDKEKFPTFGRTRPPDNQISKSVVSLLLAYNWTQVTFFYLDNADNEMMPIAPTVINTLKQADIRVRSTLTWSNMYLHGYMKNPFDDLVENTYKDTRIYLILGHYYEHLGLLNSLQKKGLLDKGEYFVVGIDIEQYDTSEPHKYLQGLFQNTQDPEIVSAYQSYLGVVPSPAIEFDDFAIQVNKYLELPPFNFPNPIGGFGGVKQIRAEAAYLYDAIHLYADALLKILENKENPRNGTAVINKIKKSSYKSAMGYFVHIDSNGDAAGNYTIVSRMLKNDPTTNKSIYGLFPIGVFVPGLENNQIPKVQLYEQINWVAGKPPIAEPKCGFRGENCISYTQEISAGIAGAILLILTIVSLILHRNWRYEQELDSLLWKIDFKDIQMHESDSNGTNGQQKPTRTTHPLIRTSQVSLSSNPDADFRYSTIFTPIGLYKGQLYAIKKIRKKSIDITREMKKELKMLRDIRHDNLNAFIGACTEPPNICIITEYCTRGSLKDVLENDDVKLDNMFIASLVGDIIRGMIYLHDSPLRIHGSLCTSNCLIDSRWVVKLSDFGLYAFKSGENALPGTNNNVNDHHEIDEDLIQIHDRRGSEEAKKLSAKFEKLLYKAPELLRNLSSFSTALIPGSQKADVYAFALVLYEIHTRNGPFGDIQFTYIECLNYITQPIDITNPFRPSLQPLETSFDCVRECIRECWQENSELRPDFKTIRVKLRPLRKGMRQNIFDNMMAMMEKYANNLEQLVDERTDQLQEEKKKTEALLLEMLPRPVAEQLKKGNKVEAENYDMVTIYFSDIVGFTAMSAESTPLQVVDFLNDLYTCFDSIIGNYDVYKVETIGDAYMCCSGLPIRNGDLHAAEIASMSLHLLSAISKFTIRHRPNDKLLLRIGIHTGAVCAGVVGLKMPRYCLFGDSVNTCSRMESCGEALKIHISPQTKEKLDKLGGYITEKRGLIPMKGKGEVMTYWLTGELEEHKIQRDHARTERRASKNRAKDISKFLMSQPLHKSSLKPNSSFANSRHSSANRLMPFATNLQRSSSFDSPKKLRFATGNNLEHTNRYHRYSDDLTEVVSDATITNTTPSPVSRKSNGSLALPDDGSICVSCPCIDNIDKTIQNNVVRVFTEKNVKDKKIQNIEMNPLHDLNEKLLQEKTSVNCTTPLLLNTGN